MSVSTLLHSILKSASLKIQLRSIGSARRFRPFWRSSNYVSATNSLLLFMPSTTTPLRHSKQCTFRCYFVFFSVLRRNVFLSKKWARVCFFVRVFWNRFEKNRRGAKALQKKTVSRQSRWIKGSLTLKEKTSFSYLIKICSSITVLYALLRTNWQNL